MYKKHHRIRGILVASLPHKEYLKMSYKTNPKAMFASLSSNYEVNKKVKEAKAYQEFLGQRKWLQRSKKRKEKSGHFIADCLDL
jgi:hypothetical protein